MPLREALFRRHNVIPRLSLTEKCRIATRNNLLCTAVSRADGFIAEYEIWGIKLDPDTRSQLREWYERELSKAEAPDSGTGDTTKRSKDLPPLSDHQTAPPQLTVLWDLESIRPFTQQHRQHPTPADGTAAANAASTNANATTNAGGSSGGSRRGSRLAAAGLSTASSPDLVGALDTLCRTLQEYGTVHAVHLFLRESALAKAPALRRQVAQLTTWTEAEAEAETGLEAEVEAEAPVELAAAPESQESKGQAQSALDPSGRSTASRGVGTSTGSGNSTSVSGGGGKGVGRRSVTATPAHDCPMCRSAYPTRLGLLRHFATAHQAAVLQATAADPRTQIMWTRGRPVMLTAGAGPGAQAAALAGDAAAEMAGAEGPGTQQERVLVSPQEFVYARELLMRGRHLDELLSAAPVATTHTPAPAAGTTGASAAAASQARGHRQSGAGGGVAWSTPGLHIHVLSSGQATENAAAAMFSVAEQAAAALAAAPAPAPTRRFPGRSGGRRGRDSGQVTPACLCIVSDAEGLEQVLASVRRAGVLTIAVTRSSRVTADATLRWWAVQGGEYRLGGRGSDA